MLSYSHSKDCPPERRKFYLSEAKESFEIGLLTKNDNSPVTSKQELHSFIKAAFCLTTVHRWLYGESEKLHGVGQLCREALGKLHTYSTSCTEEEEKGMLAKEIMSLITSVKKHLQVKSFPNSDARSYIPDSYKGTVEKPILQGEASFERILAMHSQHHLSVCEVFENTCRVHKTTLRENLVGACITTLKTETKNIDTACNTEEIENQRKGPAKMVNSPTAGSNMERLSGQTRNKHIVSDVMKNSFNEETQPLETETNDGKSVFSRWQNRSQTTTSQNSWCKLSKSSYSSSWEELDYNSSKGSPREGQQQEKGSAEEQCCTTESDENGQAAYLRSLPPRACPPERPHSSLRPPPPSQEVDTPLARRLVEKASLGGEKLRERGHHARSSSEKNAGKVDSADVDSNAVPSLSTSFSVPARLEEVKKEEEEEEKKEEEESGSSWAELEAAAGAPPAGPGCSTSDSGREGGAAPALSRSIFPKTARDSSVCDWLRKSAVVGNGTVKVPQVDPQAETRDDTEYDFVSTGDLVNNYSVASVPEHQPTPNARTSLSLRGKISITKHFECATTEEDGEKSQDMVSSKRQSSSSLSSWHKPAQMPKNSPGGAFLNPRGSGFLFTPGRTKEEVLNARLLRDDDYMQLLAGVEHNWLVQRLMPTGIFKSKQLHKAYCKFPYSNRRFHTTTGAPTENSLD